MSYTIEEAMRNIVEGVYVDLEESCRLAGSSLDWKGLTDYIADAMHWGECAEEWQALDRDVRRALAAKIAKQYV